MKSELVVFIVGSATEPVSQLACLLRAHNIDTSFAAGGREALARIRSRPPALIVLASKLPDMDGVEVLTRLKRHEYSREIPVLFAAGGIEEQKEAFRLGVADVLSLPLRPEEAIARVQTQIQLASLRAGTSHDGAGEHYVGASLPASGLSGSWLGLATQVGRMYAFEWDTRTDEVIRSHSVTQVLAGTKDIARDTGQNWFRRVHPDDVDQLRRILSILSPVYDAYDTKYRVRRADDRWITIHESSRGFFDSENRLIRVAGVVIDVTDQVRAERDLVGTQTGLLELVDKLPVAVALTNEYGWMEYINESFKRTFGYRLDEIARPDDWWRHAYPEEHYRRDVIAAWEQSTAVNQREGNIPPQEYRIVAKDGALHTVQISAAVLGRRKLIVFDDITERKRSEAELRDSEERVRLIADTAPAMLWLGGPDRSRIFFNKGWLDFTGRTIEQEIGDGWSESVHPDDVERCLATCREAFDARRRFQMEYRLRRADADYGWVLDTGVPRFEKDGAFAGYIGSCVDLSESKRQQEQMFAVQKLESLGVIASGVAHDLNNLLSCILVDASNTLSELEPGCHARDGLQRIGAVAVRASEIVQQIMAYSGKEQPDIEPVNLVALIKDILCLLQVYMPKNVDLQLDLPYGLPRIRANAAQIRQVVMNLILNAEEAFGERTGAIQVRARRERLGGGIRAMPGRATLRDGEYICMEISDTGLGMTEEIQSRIFDPSFTTKIQGRGLGLATVHRIVRNHRGAINVDSTPGVGTCFEILLPCADESEAVEPQVMEPSETAEMPTASILIIEDEETLRVSVSRILRKRGFSVLEAPDGDFAMNLIRTHDAAIGVVLLDLTLPGKSSLEILEELQRSRPDAKVILTSAYGWEGVSGRLRALRHEFIRKPYQVGELVSLVRNVLLPLETGARQAQSGGAK